MAAKGEAMKIDVDSYRADEAAGKKKVEGEVIDLDFGAVQYIDVYSEANDGDLDFSAIQDMIGVATNSKSKPEIIYVDSDTDDANGQVLIKHDLKSVTQVLKKPKVGTLTKKAPVLPDQGVPDFLKKDFHVIQMGDTVYDAMLTHTNIVDNTNDFYVLQVLKGNASSTYMVYNRWGRVGEQGETKLFGPYSSCSIAIQQFAEIFYLKTKNHWAERKFFVSYPKRLVGNELSKKGLIFKVTLQNFQDQGQSSLPSAGTRTFGPRVETFMSLICNFNIMAQEMKDIGYDAKKLPLQNLSNSTIMKAYDVLTLIAEVIGESNRQLLEELSGEFYTIIPHDFGDKSMRHYIIDSREKLRTKLEMVESLGEIEHAVRLVGHCAGLKGDVMFAQYQLLRCTLAPIETSTAEYDMIENYMKNTAGDRTPNITQIFRVGKEGENERFRKYADTKNRMLLWHGSRLTNWLGILSQGLRIAPPNVPLSGASYGRGIYFSDMFAKSSMYTYAFPTKLSSNTSSVTNQNIGILLLCEVALGEMENAVKGRSGQLPPGKLSVKAAGSTVPPSYRVLEDGVIIPTGKAVTQNSAMRSYSEYVVYKEDQVKMRYIVQVSYK